MKRKRFTAEDRLAIYKKTNGRCGYCGVKLGKFHIDHIVPISCAQGSNEMKNLLAACPPCNNLKNTFTLEEFRKEIQAQASRANKYSVNFRTALRFKQIVFPALPRPIKFYFEEIEG